MSKDIAFEADIGNIPSNYVALLTSLSPWLRAFSVDNVNPLAVIQVESIGSCFHINGKFAEKVPDMLVRSPSYRLERLSQLVGWHSGDTASAMAQTAGGRASALLCLVLGEVFELWEVGRLLYQLSAVLIPVERQQTSMVQLGEVASTLSNKLRALGFGSHLALHVTRIREVYFNSGQAIPQDLLSTPTVETMVQFLQDLSRALREETSIIYWEGREGAGYIVSLVMALCPEDVWVSVEGDLILQGDRRSVVISIMSEGPTRFSLETLLHGSGTRSTAQLVIVRDAELDRTGWSLSMKWEGSLADAIDLKLVEIGARSTYELRLSCVELLATVVFTCSGEELSNRAREVSDTGQINGKVYRIYPHSDYPDVPLPDSGLKGLLGPDPMNRVRDRLSLLFLAEPSFTSSDCVSSYHELRLQVNALLPSGACKCGKGIAHHGWGERDESPWRDCDPTKRKCPVARLWIGLGNILVKGIAALFVDFGKNTYLGLRGDDIGYRVYDTGCNVPRYFNFSEGKHVSRRFSSIWLHNAILALVGWVYDSVGTIGISSGSSSVYPTTIESPSLTNFPILRYRLLDGIFHDGTNIHNTIKTEKCSPRHLAPASLTQNEIPIFPSYIGSHDSLTMTTRNAPMRLMLRTAIQSGTQMVWVDFLAVHLACMSLSIAQSCGHNHYEPLAEKHANIVATTSVMAPLFKSPPPWPTRFSSPVHFLESPSPFASPSSSPSLRPALNTISPFLTLGSEVPDAEPLPESPSPVELTTSVDEQLERPLLSLTLTHCNSEAQFLCCVYGIRTLFQADSCLNCAIEEALQAEFQMVIQS